MTTRRSQVQVLYGPPIKNPETCTFQGLFYIHILLSDLVFVFRFLIKFLVLFLHSPGADAQQYEGEGESEDCGEYGACDAAYWLIGIIAVDNDEIYYADGQSCTEGCQKVGAGFGLELSVPDAVLQAADKQINACDEEYDGLSGESLPITFESYLLYDHCGHKQPEGQPE